MLELKQPEHALTSKYRLFFDLTNEPNLLSSFDMNFLKERQDDVSTLKRIRDKLIISFEATGGDSVKNRIDAYLNVLAYLDHYHLPAWHTGISFAKGEKLRRQKLEVGHDFLISYEKERHNVDEWSIKQIKHFNFVFSVILSWHDCFISYSHDKDSSKLFGKHLSNGHTHVAETIYKRLCIDKGLKKTWFDIKDLALGVSLGPELKEKCQSSLVFLQLLDSVSFNKGGENHQHFEFAAALEKRNQLIEEYPWLKEYFSRQIIGVALEKREDIVRNEFFADWWDYFFDSKEGSLYKMLKYEDESYRDFRASIDDLYDSIERLKDDIRYSSP